METEVSDHLIHSTQKCDKIEIADTNKSVIK